MSRIDRFPDPPIKCWLCKNPITHFPPKYRQVVPSYVGRYMDIFYFCSANCLDIWEKADGF